MMARKKTATTEEKQSEKDSNETEEWRTSKARDKLCDLVIEGTIPPSTELKPKEVHATYCAHLPEFKNFQDYTKLDFATKLWSARERVGKKKGRADDDAAALAHDRKMYPAPTHDVHGDEMWKGSKAQELLKKDIADGLLDKLKPKQLYEKREECYLHLNADRFRNRTYQEIKVAKRHDFIIEKRQKAAAKANK